MFVRPTLATAGNILVVGDMKLGLNASCRITLNSTTLGLSLVSSATLTLNTFTHVVLRFAGGTAYLFVNGVASGSQAMAGSKSLAPTEMRLGGFVGQIDEFMFRHATGTGNPDVPQGPYQATVKSNAVGGFGDGHYGDVTLPESV